MPGELLSCVEVEPRGKAQASVIWLHGLGADGHDFEPLVPYLELPPDVGVRFVFPNAPQRAVTINTGMLMPAWYDIRGLDLRHDEDEIGIAASAIQIAALIEREVARGIDESRIALAGFSQGGAIALHVALRHPRPLAGVMALSTYLVLADRIAAERAPVSQALPIFMAHGTEDPMVAIDRGEASCRHLETLGYTVEWHEYPMAHEVCPAEVRDIARWLRARIVDEATPTAGV
jgi:phospholipase/carboxylesterase